MSIFKSILARIFPSNHPANTQVSGADAPVAGTGAGASTQPSGGGAGSVSAPSSAAGAASSPAPATGTAPATMPEVDVRAVLLDLQGKNPQKLNWETSIVDLMKLLGLDSSLAARKSLASELGYSGNMEDSASMNVWLHKQVMTKLAENGGKVPDELRH
ncbi:hypothetical protein AKI39_15925 [Bordetella sp. H567]|uniref:DUF3597 domain-containing protein n=1 Tax=Bordetella sp. H567 TaxID=1697043 RepID=UPI00081CB576|nr:DUF3597 domain-containing protein [Bordetella sp. H567]AOB31873.1 hypothetical protein AKI39_15925 [Bordetella sp. H567]